MEYEKLLKKGISELPKTSITKVRFEIPKVKGHIQGNKTLITNFFQITNILNREPQHLLKFLLRELATPGTLDTNRLVLGRKISSSSVNEKIERYAKLYVICPECQKPDTKLIKENKILIIKCTACGAKHPVTAKI